MPLLKNITVIIVGLGALLALNDISAPFYPFRVGVGPSALTSQPLPLASVLPPSRLAVQTGHVETETTNKDTAPPTANIVEPRPEQTVFGDTLITAVASDNVGVRWVQFSINGKHFGSHDTTAPYSINWTTGAYPDGVYALRATAADTSGNRKVSDPVYVNVNNANQEPAPEPSPEPTPEPTPAPAPAPTVSLSANPISISSGQSSTLTWVSTDASSCGASGDWSGARATSGSESVSPTQSALYTLTCTSEAGSAAQSAAVSVLSAIQLPSSTKFVVGDRVQTTANLNVRSSPSLSSVILDTQPLGTQGSVIGGPVFADSYNWWQINYDSAHDGWSIEDFLVKVTATSTPTTPAPTLTLTANPTSITPGQSATLSWNSTNATSCSASGGWSGTKETSGSLAVSPSLSTTYSLTCSGSGGSVSSNAIISVSTLSFNPPELPRAYVDTSMPARTGKTINVAPGDSQGFKNAITAALPGDTIVLAAGSTYNGNFVLPAKSNPNNQWITITTSAESQLPFPGTRVTPADASKMAKLYLPDGQVVLKINPAANYYRLIGLEITADGTFLMATYPDGTPIYLHNGLVRVGSQGAEQDALSEVPHHIVADRMYVHGNRQLHVKTGFTLQCGDCAVIDSYVSEIHGIGQDTQAIVSYNGSGPFKIVNNFLEGSGENVMFGGADASIFEMIPSDIEIRGNYFFKPTSWRLGDPNYVGVSWLVKNLFEMKVGERIWVEGNVFEHSWSHGQTGNAILIKSVNQDGGNPWNHTKNLTFRNNIIRGAARAIVLCDNCQAPTTKGGNWWISNNLWIDIDPVKWNGTGITGDCCAGLVSISGSSDNVTFDHNTGLQLNGNMITASGGTTNSNDFFIFKNNIANYGSFGLFNEGGNSIPGAEVASNVVVGQALSSSIWPGNFNSSTVGGVGFVGGSNPVSPTDFALNSTSLFKNKASDGRDPGADVGTILTATQYSVSGGR